MALPTGIVTFLMTDIEGSTHIWEADPGGMARALERHDALLGAAVTRNSGTVVKHRGEGDSLFCVFARTAGAVAAALESQQSLWSDQSEPGNRLRVRMAIHAGDVVLRGGDYYGPAVNRCARLRAIANGGQILLTMAAAELARDHLPPSAELRDLGEHFLRDIARSESVHQLMHPTIPADFPPLKSAGKRHHNLPVQLTSFVGRTSELAEVQRLLSQSRLVTLVGPGGAGKTRLAVEASVGIAPAYEGGLWFVELAPVPEADQFIRAVASALQIRDEPGRTVSELVLNRLDAVQTVLAVDNCEHLLPGVAQQLNVWLRSITGLRIIATSREALGIPGEKVLRIGSLGRDQALRLFTERRGQDPDAAAPDGDVIARICDRLDRLPLAIELTAARASSIPLERILERLEARLPLTHASNVGLADRQQTLRSTVDWSYQLLEVDSQALFRRLAVFANGFQIEAAEAVTSDEHVLKGDVMELVGRLYDKSLIVRGEGADGRFRYGFLQTIGEFALERLQESNEEGLIRLRHLEYMLKLAEEAVPNLRRRGQHSWLGKVEDEQDNLRAAVAWSFANDAEAHRRLVATLADFWPMVAPVDEIIEWLDRAIAMRPGAVDAAQALLLEGRGRVVEILGDYGSAIDSGEAALHIWELLGDRNSMASCLDRIGGVMVMSAAAREAAGLFERAIQLSREVGDQRLLARATANLGATLIDDIETRARAGRLLEEGLVLFGEDGDDWGVANVHNNLGDLAMSNVDLSGAVSHYRRSIALMRGMGYRARHLPSNLDGCAAVAAALGQHERALRLAGGCQELRRRIGMPIPPIQLKLVEKWLAPSRTTLGENAATKAWEEGEVMGFEALLDYALTDTEASALNY